MHWKGLPKNMLPQPNDIQCNVVTLTLQNCTLRSYVKLGTQSEHRHQKKKNTTKEAVAAARQLPLLTGTCTITHTQMHGHAQPRTSASAPRKCCYKNAPRFKTGEKVRKKYFKTLPKEREWLRCRAPNYAQHGREDFHCS